MCYSPESKVNREVANFIKIKQDRYYTCFKTSRVSKLWKSVQKVYAQKIQLKCAKLCDPLSALIKNSFQKKIVTLEARAVF